jgi:hypothetical protein
VPQAVGYDSEESCECEKTSDCEKDQDPDEAVRQAVASGPTVVAVE